jgi:hypothetical protein
MPTIDRQSLHFAETVERYFAFLAGHGFKRVQKETTFVRFESGRLYVNIYHGRQSYEMELEIGSYGISDPPYSILDLIRLLEPKKAAEYRRYAAHIAKDVDNGVQRLASLFRRYVDAGALDDARIFERLQKSRSAAVHGYWKGMKLTQVRQQLDAAWHAKNYAKIIALLEPHRSDLFPTELKKLNYAKQRIAHSGKMD